MATKKRTGVFEKSFETALAATRRPVKQTFTIRLLPEDVERLERFAAHTGARGAGEVITVLVRKAMKDAGLE